MMKTGRLTRQARHEHSETPKPRRVSRRDLVAPELDALQAQLQQERSRTAALTEQVEQLEAGARHSSRIIDEAHAQLERERCGHLRYVRATEAQSTQQQLMIKKRSEEIANLLERSGGSGGGGGAAGAVRDETMQALLLVIADLRKEAEAKQGEEKPCCICFDRPANAVFLPCKHGGSCLECAQKLMPGRCPLCRTTITECMQVFT